MYFVPTIGVLTKMAKVTTLSLFECSCGVLGSTRDISLLKYAMFSLEQGSPNFLSEGHVIYYTTVREPDLLRNMIVSGYVTSYQINKCFVNIL